MTPYRGRSLMLDNTARRANAIEDQAPSTWRDSQRLHALGTYALSFFVFFLLWHILATYISPSVLFSPPLHVFAAAYKLVISGSLTINVVASMQRILLGFLIGSLLGIPIGLLMGNFLFIRRFLEPFTEFLRFVPAIALLTLAIIWFGLGETSKIFLIVYATIFIVVLNTMSGVLSIPVNKIRAARCLGASRVQIFCFVSLPATVPYILTGMRIAMGNSFMTMVGAEMLAANAGIGQMMWTARLFMQVDDLYVALLVLGILGFMTDRVFRLLIVRFAGRYSMAQI
jgi:ABC-type nitrate/sulfonate/bicarbonate transport system permease component